MTMSRQAVPASVRDEALVAQRRAAIVRACVPLFHRQGYHQTTTRQIAAAAGMTMGGLYLYIREKADCLRLILGAVRDDLRTPGDDDPDVDAVSALRALVVDVVTGMHRRRREIIVLDRAREALMASAPAEAFGYERDVVGRIATLLRRGVEEGTMRCADDVDATALAVFWQCLLWVHRYEVLRPGRDPAAVAALQADLLLTGLRVR